MSATATAPDHIPVITDPMFYLLAVPAVMLLGLGKGGFAGVGMVAAPMLALACRRCKAPPLCCRS